MRIRAAFAVVATALLVAGCGSTGPGPSTASVRDPAPRCVTAAIEEQAAAALASPDDSVSRLLAYPSEVEPSAQAQQQEAWDRLTPDEVELQRCMHHLQDQVG